ncbi:MAG: penicillin-binding transpeptidase domain-containing protein, partial [Clostridia bacterium]
ATFGFNENFLFRDLVLYNSSYPVSHQNRDDLAWSGIGQGRVLVTPLHMAMIAGAVANKGVMMEPRLLYAVRNGRGQQRVMQASRVYRRSLPVDRAQMLCEQMLQTVQDGTGTRAALAGYAVGGKTGTAEVSNDKSIEPHAWYMGFIQDARHPLAIVVLVENGGGGGTVAAPIARRVMERAIALGY